MFRNACILVTFDRMPVSIRTTRSQYVLESLLSHLLHRVIIARRVVLCDRSAIEREKHRPRPVAVVVTGADVAGDVTTSDERVAELAELQDQVGDEVVEGGGLLGLLLALQLQPVGLPALPGNGPLWGVGVFGDQYLPVHKKSQEDASVNWMERLRRAVLANNKEV